MWISIFKNHGDYLWQMFLSLSMGHLQSSR
nr:MAG TPA: hypothetical protein [Caudoviricetes sp.]DAO14860.1 MAG TPA: hypothetical protein [Bacteriophage sp.]DAK22786.1 MAG TPA: hypothetical protein [Caudoviricetes sp.]DAK82057.1 MAG TPA: hypothetical protein [Caudoviricetes sp.]DAO99386.1 MAG TPA: hypothetical protein [Caudoviricetes sp.]